MEPGVCPDRAGGAPSQVSFARTLGLLLVGLHALLPTGASLLALAKVERGITVFVSEKVGIVSWEVTADCHQHLNILQEV